MAFFDNKLWLLSHIRNSFICTDDTGMCETVMASEDIPKQLPRTSIHDTYPGFEESSDEDEMDISESYEIQPNFMDTSGYRPRSNTAQHIEKMNIARKKAAKTKNIKWETSQHQLTEEEKAELFTKKVIARPSSNELPIKKASLLTDLLSKNDVGPRNPFMEYSVYDGSARVGIPTRKFKIFFTMVAESERNYPLHVCIISTARISDLIGLSILKYSVAHPEQQFKEISYYDLFITEDDGEMDKDFPPLDSRECVNKFSFNFLSLVEHKQKKSISFEAITERPQTVVQRRDEESSKHRATNQDFFDDLAKLRDYTGAVLAPIYKCYKVYVINKMRTKIEVNLGISGDKIEIDPVQQKNSKFWLRQKAVNYHIDNIVWCEIIDDSKLSRNVFRLVYTLAPVAADTTFSGASSAPSLKSSPSFKNHDFETDKATADEIVQKINHILEFKSSLTRKDYLSFRERKANRRRSFHLGSKTS